MREIDTVQAADVVGQFGAACVRKNEQEECARSSEAINLHGEWGLAGKRRIEGNRPNNLSRCA